MRKSIFLLAIALSLPLAAEAAQSPQSSSQDRSWLIAAHQDNLAEIKSGDLAAEKGHDADVRAAARTLTRDHGNLDAKLRPVAKQLGVKLPAQPNAQQRDEMRKFESASGVDFDRTWTHDEADAHVKAIELTVRETQHGSLPQVKQLAQSALPVLKKHLHMLQQTQSARSGNQ
jgi:putative membrane protein